MIDQSDSKRSSLREDFSSILDRLLALGADYGMGEYAPGDYGSRTDSFVMESEATPSFALMDIQGPVIVTYVYQLVDGEVSDHIRASSES